MLVLPLPNSPLELSTRQVPLQEGTNKRLNQRRIESKLNKISIHLNILNLYFTLTVLKNLIIKVYSIYLSVLRSVFPLKLKSPEKKT